MCMGYTPIFFFPPHELLQLATCAREWSQAEVRFLDAIAEKCEEATLHAFLAQENPDTVVSLIGIDSVASDLAIMDRIKAAFPQMTCIVFGFYPTVLSEEILGISRVDFILRGEPEVTLSKYLRTRNSGGDVDTIVGLAGRREDGMLFVNPHERIQDFDKLPFPDYTLLDVRKYEEGMVGGPCGAIFTARGCPFQCNYCTTTYGRKVVQKSPETVLAEAKGLVRAGVRVIRFLDDTFTISKPRVIAICKGMIDQGISVRWACLARVDTLDAEMLSWMKRAGCARILVGVESYSRRVLDYLNKGADPATFNAKLALIRKAGIESVGFILLGAPVETEEDFQETVRNVLASPLDLIGVNRLTPYAGTPLFEKARDDIVFSLVPYECRFKDESISRNAARRERLLYRRFYLRPVMFWRQLYRALRFPLGSMRLLFILLKSHTMRVPSP